MIFGFLTKFWILKNLFRKKIFFLEMKNIFRKSAEFFFETKKCSKNFLMKKSMKNQNFKISIFRARKIEILKFWFFIDFFIKKFFEHFLVSKKNSALFRKIFFISRKNIFFRNKFFKIQNLVRNPKIILRKLYEHSKIV